MLSRWQAESGRYVKEPGKIGIGILVGMVLEHCMPKTQLWITLKILVFQLKKVKIKSIFECAKRKSKPEICLFVFSEHLKIFTLHKTDLKLNVLTCLKN